MRTKTLKTGKKLLATAMTAVMLAVLSMLVSSTPVFAAEIDDGTGITAENMAAHKRLSRWCRQERKTVLSWCLSLPSKNPMT